ncbi:NAD-dependent epimerase/dehydratase family protein [Shewanella waksmanii]|uniref:NAD-dependent epimerase/dehydratase family protein n=1 Tax=Shewanella waksmanii TaxID=213783 RepID=UPI00048ECAE0|nr:NAD-dependent epimerase/dehydratase family protein [Shewanella waksmanii]
MQYERSVLLVGGFGFLGKHLISYLKTTCISPIVIAKNRPEEEWRDVEYHLIDSLSSSDLQILSDKVEAVIYMASSSVPSTGAIMKELQYTVTPAIDLIDKLTDANRDLKVIYLSSGGQVYGNELTERAKESMIPKPVSAYAFGKYLTEQSLEYLSRSKNTPVAILRVSNPIGKWQQGLKQGLFNVTYNALQNDSELIVFGSGHECRDYVDADELSFAIYKVINGSFTYGVWNVGSGVATSTLELIGEIETAYGKKVGKVFKNRRDVDPEYSVLNCEKFQRDFDWRASLSIKDIVKKTLKKKLMQ